MKKMNNKGFSLVELIVVIAIMGVLMVVLAPQYLRYVEKSRLQKDNSAIAEVAENIKIALSDQQIYEKVTTGTTVTIGGSGVKVTGASELKTELQNTIGSLTDVTLTSNAYKGNTVTLTITQSSSTGNTFVVTGSGLYFSVGQKNASSTTF